jgi:hypothetical protein
MPDAPVILPRAVERHDHAPFLLHATNVDGGGRILTT